MGRTRLTYRDRLRAWIDDLENYRRGLRRQRQEVFDRLTDSAFETALAGKHQNPTELDTIVLLSICIEQQREIDELRDELEQMDSESTGDTAE